MLCLAFSLVMAVSPAGQEQAFGETPSLAELRNAVYRSPWTPSGTAPLTDGEYREPAASGSAVQTRVKLTKWIAFGTVDGKAAAAVILVTDPGGSGIFYDLALVVRRYGGLTNPATAHLGDRVKIDSLAMKNGMIVVDMKDHGPGDPMCCPRHARRRTFSVRNDRLLPIRE